MSRFRLTRRPVGSFDLHFDDFVRMVHNHLSLHIWIICIRSSSSSYQSHKRIPKSKSYLRVAITWCQKKCQWGGSGEKQTLSTLFNCRPHSWKFPTIKGHKELHFCPSFCSRTVVLHLICEATFLHIFLDTGHGRNFLYHFSEKSTNLYLKLISFGKIVLFQKNDRVSDWILLVHFLIHPWSVISDHQKHC